MGALTQLWCWLLCIRLFKDQNNSKNTQILTYFTTWTSSNQFLKAIFPETKHQSMITSRFELERGILQDQEAHNNCCLRSFILFKMKFVKAFWLGFFPPSRLQSTGAFLVMFLSNRYATFLASLDTRSAEIGKTAIRILVRIDHVQFLSKILPGFYSPRLQWTILFS